MHIINRFDVAFVQIREKIQSYFCIFSEIMVVSFFIKKLLTYYQKDSKITSTRDIIISIVSKN